MGPKLKRCAWENCSYTKQSGDGKAIFRFPRLIPGDERSKERLIQWRTNSGNEKLALIPLEKLHLMRYMCPHHFEQKCFRDIYGHDLLRDAVPTLGLPLSGILPEIPSVHCTCNHLASSSSTSSSSSLSAPTHSHSRKRHLDPPDNDDIPDSKIARSEYVESSSPRRSIVSMGARKRDRPPERLTLKKISGVEVYKNATPEVKRLSKTVQEYHRMAKKLKSRLQNAQRKGKNLSKLASRRFVDIVHELQISPIARRIVAAELRNFKRKPRGRSWSLDDKLFALAIFKRSPRAYRFLQKCIVLPSESTLKALLKEIPLQPGISKPLLSLLKKNVLKMKARDRTCVLLFDEMFLVKSLSYHATKGFVEGFEDFGKRGRTNLIADHALVFMAQGITRKWTQPIAYYFVSSTCPAHTLRLLIQDVVRALRSAGLKVLASVSDQGPTNQGAVSELKKSTGDDIFYEIDNERMVHIWDVPHIFKNIRNNLLTSDLEFQKGKCAKWRHIIEYYKLDESLNKLSSLSQKHLNPQGKLKMRVKYAAEALSYSVGGNMETWHSVSEGKYLSGCLPTAELCKLADKYFDLTNGPSASGKEKKKAQRCIVSDSSLHHEEWPLMIQNLEKWRYFRKSSGVCHIPPCVKGWIQTVRGMQWIWLQLKKLNVKTMSLRNLNQDAIENLFSTIRQCCGSGTDLTTVQFTAALKTCIVTRASGGGSQKNCTDDDSYLLDDMRSLLGSHCQNESDPSPSQETVFRGCQSMPNVSHDKLDEIRKEAPTFICAVIVNEVLSQHSCEACTNLLTTNKSALNFLLSKNHYDCRAIARKCPSPAALQSFLKCHSAFSQNWRKLLQKRKVLEVVQELLKSSADWRWLKMCPAGHGDDVTDKMVSKLSTYLVKRQCTLSNKEKRDKIFRRTRQTLYGAAPKNADGLRDEEASCEIDPNDLLLLNAAQQQFNKQASLATPKSQQNVATIATPKTPQVSPMLGPAYFTPQHRVSIGVARLVTPHQATTSLTTAISSTSLQIPATPQSISALQPGTPGSARERVRQSWAVPYTTVTASISKKSKASNEITPDMDKYVRERKVDDLTKPPLENFLRGKIKRVSGLKKHELVEAVYNYYERTKQ